MNVSSLDYLRKLLGPNADFRDGQAEAISEIVENKSKLLLVQRTGWGKSLVYFIATKMLRDRGSGPAILISPLLSLMRNQIRMVENHKFIRVGRIDSSNKDQWDAVIAGIKTNNIDMLLTAPERLANEDFNNNVLPYINRGIGFFIVDEAHCISDWGHDFRPDYRRIQRVITKLPRNIPVLATTATANNRVIDDIQEQIGDGLKIFRGRLGRDSLSLRNIVFENPAERYAWLANVINQMKGSGIVYCLTVRDSERVAKWLRSNNIDAYAYNAGIQNEERVALEDDLIRNRIKALVATVALGMGFDKPDLSFVIHFQKPGSVIHYYQQVGRAGRALDTAQGILLYMKSDDRINEYFIRDAFTPEYIQQAIVDAVANSPDGLTMGEVQKQVNIRYARLEEALKILAIEGVLSVINRKYYRTLNPWKPDIDRMYKVTQQRKTELNRINEYVFHNGCLMKFLCDELDDPHASICGRCASCRNVPAKENIPSELIHAAKLFIKENEYRIIKPKGFWPEGIKDPVRRKKIYHNILEGRALSAYNDYGLGQLVHDGKYIHAEYGDELLTASVDFIRNNWRPDPFPEWVTAIPSSRTQHLVPLFAMRLAEKLRIPFMMVLRKRMNNQEQKTMNNSYQQCSNVLDSFEIFDKCLPGAVLLVDDIVDSGWTMTIAGIILNENGCGQVIPFTLAAAPSRGE